MEFAARKSCPDEEIIADYLEGRLSTEAREALDAHFSDCELCLEELVIAGKAARDAAGLPEAPSGVTEAAVRLAARQLGAASEKGLRGYLSACAEKISGYLHDSFPWRLPQAALRSSKTSAAPGLVMVTKVFKGVEANIEIEKTGEGKAHIRVRAPGSEKNGIRVTLKKGKRETSSQHLRGGYALFDDIPFGRYEIVLSSNGSVLGTYTFEIRESRHG